jgi:hypothetical protein
VGRLPHLLLQEAWGPARHLQALACARPAAAAELPPPPLQPLQPLLQLGCRFLQLLL